MIAPDKLFIDAVNLLPKKALSRKVRGLAQVRSQMAVRRFAAAYNIDTDEAELPLSEYHTVLDFFTRRLKPGARTIDQDPRTLVSPVDGNFSVAGEVGEGELYQAKGHTFGLTQLLADPEAEKTFAGGSYFTIYLAPSNYHRIHSPVDGTITGYTYVPGELFPVNVPAVTHVDSLFARNERLITHLQSEVFGKVALVKVGATCVGHITTAYDSSVRTNMGEGIVRKEAYHPAKPIVRGGELATFELGSTVVVIVEKSLGFGFQEPQRAVRLGEAISQLAE